MSTALPDLSAQSILVAPSGEIKAFTGFQKLSRPMPFAYHFHRLFSIPEFDRAEEAFREGSLAGLPGTARATFRSDLAQIQEAMMVEWMVYGLSDLLDADEDDLSLDYVEVPKFTRQITLMRRAKSQFEDA